MAPYLNGRLPIDEDFRQVVCKDISPGGLAYVTAEPPTCEFVIVALGSSSPVFLSAAVVRKARLALGNERLTLVAVEFITRVRIPGFGTLVANPPAYAAALLRTFSR